MCGPEMHFYRRISVMRIGYEKEIGCPVRGQPISRSTVYYWALVGGSHTFQPLSVCWRSKVRAERLFGSASV